MEGLQNIEVENTELEKIDTGLILEKATSFYNNGLSLL